MERSGLCVQKEARSSAEQLGDGEAVFLWSEKRLVITLREGVYEVVTAVEKIVVMEVSLWKRRFDAPSPLNFI